MTKRIIKLIMAAILSAVTVLTPLTALADGWQSTVIIIDNEKSVYNTGDVINFTIGIADPNGGYIVSADCGFGYSTDTMKLISETDTPDHVSLSGGPAKWLYRTLTFEVTSPGSVYFVAGAYSGAGQARVVTADGNVVRCPRASVVYGAKGAKQEKPEEKPKAEPVASSLRAVFEDTGEEVELNREFDSLITEYDAVLDASDAGRKIVLKAVPGTGAGVKSSDTAELKTGENILKTVITADGNERTYSVKLTVPEDAAKLTDIRVGTDKGQIDIGFSTENMEYSLDVDTDTDTIRFDADGGKDLKVTYPDSHLDYGMNVKYLNVHIGKKDVRYTFYIYRKPPELSLTSMVVELSDDTTLELDKPFSPDVTEYKGHVTSDVKQAVFHTSHASADTDVKVYDGSEEEVPGDENGTYAVDLKNGENNIRLSVTDGYNELNYAVSIDRDMPEIVTAPEETTPAPNFLEHTFAETSNTTWMIIACVAAAAVIGGIAIFVTLKRVNIYKKSPEGKADAMEQDRAKRLKEKAKQRQKAAEEAEKAKKKKK